MTRKRGLLLGLILLLAATGVLLASGVLARPGYEDGNPASSPIGCFQGANGTAGCHATRTSSPGHFQGTHGGIQLETEVQNIGGTDYDVVVGLDGQVGECYTCHEFYQETIHGGWAALAEACARCHRTHTAAADDLLVMGKDDLCLFCHGGTAGQAQTNVADGLLRNNGSALRGGGFVQATMNTHTPADASHEDLWEYPVAQAGPSGVTSAHGLGAEALIWGSGPISETVPNAGTTATILECVSCHDPHIYGETYRLLRPQPVDSVLDDAEAPGYAMVTDILSFARWNPSSDALSYTTTDYTEVEYAAPDVYDDEGNIVMVTGPPPVGTVTKYSQQIARWCAACHERYHRQQQGHGTHAADEDSGDAIFSYGHKTGDDMSSGTTTTSCGYDGTNCHGAEANGIDINRSLTCLGCHVSHGTSATMGLYAASVPWPGEGVWNGTTYDLDTTYDGLPGTAVDAAAMDAWRTGALFGDGGADISDQYTSADWGNRSSLLRLNNRGVCQNSYCHPKGTGLLLDGFEQGRDNGYWDSGEEPEICAQCHGENITGGCTGCHSSTQGDRAPFGDEDGAALWPLSSHFAIGCGGCHVDQHNGTLTLGTSVAPDEYSEVSTNGDIPNLDQFCFTCHTDGMVENLALTGPVDDIEEAFSQAERHDLGTTFTVGGETFTLQCTTCHNPHTVTGKHWLVDTGVSPVTRPDFTDPVGNPRAVGAAVWGAVSGEKMADFASMGAGTGGWYYNVARGGTISFGQPAVYQPPKAEGWDGTTNRVYEFGGDVLPDYTTLCLDCHTYRMSASNPPVNWGQPGVSPTGNSVDPPDQRIEGGAQHGLGAANLPSYSNDYYWDSAAGEWKWGTAGFWGTSGNDDPIFNMNYVTRGRGVGHFMRWPYDSAQRSAGINFVMSCTDCHESHGSNAGSMIRTWVNYGGGDGGNWNVFCNNCHYYYGGQHAGMSCGNASCHEANSIHRIIHNTASGGTQLQVTADALPDDPEGKANWESYYQRPTFTPEIASVEGTAGSNQLWVTFTEGVWTNEGLTEALVPEDFWLTDMGSDNPRGIDSVAHTPGGATAVITMSAVLLQADIGSDILATRGQSVWNWDETGYTNQVGTPIPPGAVPAGPWPVTITAMPSIITNAQGVVDHEKLAVWFADRTYANPDATGALQAADFVLANAGGKTIISVDHAPGRPTATLTLSGPVTGGDIGVATVAPAANSIFTDTGAAALEASWTLTAGQQTWIASVEGIDGGAKLRVTFESQVWAADGGTGALEAGDFSYGDVSTGGASGIASVAHSPGNPVAIITLNGALVAGDIGNDTLAAVADSVFGPASGHFPAVTDTVAIAAQTAPVIQRVEGVEGYEQVLVSFSQGVYAAGDGTGVLQPGDFTYGDVAGGGATSIASVSHTAGGSTAVVTLNGLLATGDIDTDTVMASGIFNSIGNAVVTTPVAIAGTTWPVWGATFDIEDEPQAANPIYDTTGLLSGTVGNPAFAFSDPTDNDVFNGEEAQLTYIDFGPSHSLQSPRALTVEALVKPTVVDRDEYGDNAFNEFNRVFERRGTLLITILNTWYRGDDIPSRYGKASIEVKYRVENFFGAGAKIKAPHPQWPADPYVGNGVRMHQISSSIDDYPIVNDHWYLIRVVFNSDKADVAGSDGTPVDIFIDDLGVNGDDVGENWSGYKNASVGINNSSSSKWGALPGDVINLNPVFGGNPANSVIGSNWNYNPIHVFDGQIDWLTFKPWADYTGTNVMGRGPSDPPR